MLYGNPSPCTKLLFAIRRRSKPLASLLFASGTVTVFAVNVWQSEHDA